LKVDPNSAERFVHEKPTKSRTLSGSAARHHRKARLAFVYEVIGELADMRHRKALLLSGGQQKLVALGRALGIGTKCLLLDEPFEGIAPALSERLSEVLASLKGGDLTLLMSQSDMNHSRGLIDVEFTIERGANLVPG
jgi:branched-chain amino acid transport system ATP-binding protein